MAWFILMDNILAYNEVVSRLRAFFQGEKGFIEVPAQARRSILAACEDPSTIAEYTFSGVNWPLPQTGQMWLEHELLNSPDLPGVFCVTTSYRDEPDPIPGRHDVIFPMFEFESSGDIRALLQLESDLLASLGFSRNPVEVSYDQACARYGVEILEDEHEHKLHLDFDGKPIMLSKFPIRTHPFWNMRYLGNNLYAKVDVLLHGMETIGSAERSCDVVDMRHNFAIISGGEYAGLLYDRFGKTRVDDELERYFSLDMFPRFGGGIGVTRMARAMKLEGVLEAPYEVVETPAESIGVQS